MAFKVGSMAVYPSHGVAHVRSIEQREISGAVVKFYVLHVVDSGARVMVPVSSGRSQLRPIMKASMVDQVFKTLESETEIPRRAWNRRAREFHEKLSTPSTVAVAEVLRDVWVLGTQKELSFGEKQIFEKALKLMREEISVCKGWDRNHVEQKIRHSLAKSGTCADLA